MQDNRNEILPTKTKRIEEAFPYVGSVEKRERKHTSNEENDGKDRIQSWVLGQGLGSGKSHKE